LASAEVGERHRAVFELTGGEQTWAGALRNIANLREALPESDVVLVVHDDAIGLLLSADKKLTATIAEQAKGGVVFAACANTMKRKKIAPEALLDAATVVDAGIAEVVRRQEAGFSYVRVAQ